VLTSCGIIPLYRGGNVPTIVGCEVGIISTSPLRERTILRPESRIARWLPAR